MILTTIKSKWNCTSFSCKSFWISFKNIRNGHYIWNTAYDLSFILYSNKNFYKCILIFLVDVKENLHPQNLTKITTSGFLHFVKLIKVFVHFKILLTCLVITYIFWVIVVVWKVIGANEAIAIAALREEGS